MMLNFSIYEDIFIAANVHKAQAGALVLSVEASGHQVEPPRAGHDYHEELLLFTL